MCSTENPCSVSWYSAVWTELCKPKNSISLSSWKHRWDERQSALGGMKLVPENSRFEPVMKEGSNQLLLVDIHIQNTAPLWKVISQTMGGSAVSLKWVLHNNTCTLLRNRQKKWGKICTEWECQVYYFLLIFQGWGKETHFWLYLYIRIAIFLFIPGEC